MCDGQAIPSSQTLSGTTPNLTDGRFLRGFTSSSGCGGSATFTLAEGNLAAHNHGGATTSTGCALTSDSTTPGATGTCDQTTSGCGQTSSACAATTGTVSSWHTHTYTTGAQNCQHCHCICDAGVHSHSTPTGVCRAGWAGCPGLRMEGWGGNISGTDGRHHCAEHTCCTYGSTTHLHSGTTADPNNNHSHGMPNHSHTTPSHTHTTPAHSHTSAAHTHAIGSHTHSTTIASAGSGTAKEHIPVYFNVKYLIRVI